MEMGLSIDEFNNLILNYHETIVVYEVFKRQNLIIRAEDHLLYDELLEALKLLPNTDNRIIELFRKNSLKILKN